MELIARSDALAQGLTRYFTGCACKHGHVVERMTRSGACVECVRLEKKRAGRPRKMTPARIASRAAYHERNKARRSAWHVEYRKQLRSSDPVYAMSHGVRALIGGSFRARGYKKGTKTERILGCSWPEFAAHIERQFLPGMTWENREAWHIDHIVALATAKTEADVLALNHFTNLRPLWKPDNLAKGAKQTHLI